MNGFARHLGRHPRFARMLPTDAQRKTMSVKRRAREWLGHLSTQWRAQVAQLIPQRQEHVVFEAARIAKTRELTPTYAEFGVFSGRTTIQAYHALRRVYGSDGFNMIAFDSFQGLPQPQARDRERYDQFAQGQYACTQEEFVRNLERYDVDLQRLTIVPGWFSETCTEENASRLRLGPIGIAYIDCDLQSACLEVLHFLSQSLEDGGTVIFDDWNAYRGHPQLGERGAFSQWLTENPDLIATPILEHPLKPGMFSIHRRL